ncbi:MAG: hypothetical protein H0T09_02080 [Actinobacteria bacterium]|nr:hypothetical protein [Actinomycetota bacterium]
MSASRTRVDRDRPAEVVAGFLACIAIAASAIAVAYHPLVLAPFALLVAFVAAAFGGRHSRLAAWAIAAATASWVVGMSLAVITGRSLF